ncbi:MAG: TrmH family RNA methyltransferase [Bacillota bacterium]
MFMEPVTSMQNPLIKYLMKLKRRKFRESEGRFVIEGIRFVEEAIKSGWPVENLIFTPGLSESGRGDDLASASQSLGINRIIVNDKLMRELASTETPQGVLALCRMREWGMEDIFKDRPHTGFGHNKLVVVVDGVSDPGNLGTIIRSADAFGSHGALLTTGTVDLYNSKSLRATMGSVFHLPVVNNADPATLYDRLAEKGIALLVGVPEGGVPINRLNLKPPLALVVGSEADGPSRELFSYPHEKATIPMPGQSESLNAAVAASVMLYEAFRQRDDN